MALPYSASNNDPVFLLRLSCMQLTKSKSFLPSSSLNKPLGMPRCCVVWGGVGYSGAPEWFRRLRTTPNRAPNHNPTTPLYRHGTSTPPETTASRDNGNDDDDHGLPNLSHTEAIITECNTNSSYRNFALTNIKIIPQNLAPPTVICLNASAALNSHLGFDCTNGTYIPL
jgi:hypothetical protein